MGLGLDNDIDALFRLPPAEFIDARNKLAAQLKKAGRRNDADRVKLLGKPSISAWAVNQLYWMHREAFDDLIAIAKRSRPGGKVTDMRESLDARRDALSHLSDLATTLLRDAGHSPTLDTMRRITTTLEAMSTYALLPDGPTPGRLTHDVDPPSFESLASLMSGAGTKEPAAQSTRIVPFRKSASATAKPQQKATDVRRLEETRQAKIAAAKVSLQDAKRLLSDARAQTQSLEAVQKKANADAKEAEKYRREAEERLEKATAASEDTARRAQSVAAEVMEAAKALEDAKRTVERATKELESLFRESPAR
jgi:Membrane protein involved in colicin uptake